MAGVGQALPTTPGNLFLMRFLAVLIDGAAMFPVMIAFYILIIIFAFIPYIGWIFSILMYLAMFGAMVFYHLYFVSKFGATYGKRWMGLQVIHHEQRRFLSMGEVFIRALCTWVAALPCYAGLILAAFDAEGRGWHDKMAKTQVIKVREPGFDGFALPK
jgi:uncharacterized RDD family membrane protein YckC